MDTGTAVVLIRLLNQNFLIGHWNENFLNEHAHVIRMSNCYVQSHLLYIHVQQSI